MEDRDLACPKCGFENKSDATVCANCYFDLQSDRTPVQAPAPTARKAAAAAPPTASPPPGQYAPPPQPPPAQYAAPAPGPGGAYAPPYSPPGQQYGYGAPGYHAPVYSHAGFWIRVAACFIDGILLNVVGFIIGSMAGTPSTPMAPGVESNSAYRLGQTMAGGSASAVVSGLGVLYYIVMNAVCGATLGKMALGLKIVKTDGSPIGWGAAIVRYIMETILAVVTCGLMFISVATNQEKRGWHDQIAGTMVIYK